MPIKKKIGILQLVNGELYGGAERVQETILKLINQDLFESYCVSLMDGAFVNTARRKGLPIEVILMRNKFDLGVVSKLATFIKRHHISLIHTHTIRTNLVGRLAARPTKIPVVTHIHSLPLYETESRIRNRFNHVVEGFTKGWSSRYICVSGSLRSQLISKGLPAELIDVVHNGVETEQFSTSNHNEYGIRNELGIIRNAKLIAMIALFRPLKGAEILIEALAEIVPRHPDVYCLLVGGGERESYMSQLARLSRRRGLEDRTIFTGFREDISSILPGTDVVVHPSLFGEGLPLAILEAMAAARPVIASAVGGIPEIIHNGETGLLVPPNSVQALAKAISALLENPEQASKLGANARSLVRAQYDCETMVREIERVYLRLIDYDN
jgi:glycosyltransferase involved in cell wall biosynthesis